MGALRSVRLAVAVADEVDWSPDSGAVRIVAEGADLVAAQLDVLLRAASASVEFRDRLAKLGKLRGNELCVQGDDLATARAGAARVRLELPQRFLELVALAARDLDIRVGK